MNDIKNKKTISFDFGDTVASTAPSYPDRIKIALQDLDYNFSDEQFFRAYQYADYIIFKNYLNDGKISSAIYQKTLYSILLEELEIGIGIDEARRLISNKMADSNYTRELLPGADELLKHLYNSGYKLCVISNNDGKTAEKCEGVGISDYLDLIIDSTSVKKIKPDKDIFHLASRQLGIDTKDILHIGDLYGADVLGALNAGIDAIWINNKDGINYEGINIKQVKSLTEIMELFI